MEFNIRAMSLVECISADARVDLTTLLGKKCDFRAGFSYGMTLPNELEAFLRIPDAERVFTALEGWSRVYGYPNGDEEMLHVIAPFVDDEGNLNFYRLDFARAPRPRRGPRPSVQIIGGAAMNYEECGNWLVDLAQIWASDRSQQHRRFAIIRPSLKPTRVRVAWVVPQVVDERSVEERLRAIGAVYGAEIVHVEPRGYRDTQARLAKSLPYDSVVICRHFAPHITADAVPTEIPGELVLFCDSPTLEGLEAQIRTWIEVTLEEVEKRRTDSREGEAEFLLALMVNAMLNHSKIGEYSHCPKETVLKVIRGRRLNVPLAESILEKNAEQHQATKDSEAIFLWKDHNDGRQYFINPKKVEEVRIISIGVLSAQ